MIQRSAAWAGVKPTGTSPENSAAAGSTSSSGFIRNGLRMICTLATCGRAIAVSASAQVSTLTP
jgi:hypothetical protein